MSVDQSAATKGYKIWPDLAQPRAIHIDPEPGPPFSSVTMPKFVALHQVV